MKKIAIVGSNSFLAKNLAFYLKSKANEPCDLLLYDVQPATITSPAGYKQLDFEDPASLDAVDCSVDAVYFFTGLTGTKKSMERYADFVKVNELYLLNFLDAYKRKGGIAKIIYPSSRLMYASSDEPLSEDAKKSFRSIYAVGKYAAENYLEVFANLYGIKSCVLRICVPFGSLIPDSPSYGTYEFFTEQARAGKNITVFGDGSSTRTFTHMEDICKALHLVAKNDACIGVFNLGGRQKSLGEVAKEIAAQYGVGVDFVPFPKEDARFEVPRSVFDSSRLDKLLGLSYRDF